MNHKKTTAALTVAILLGCATVHAQSARLTVTGNVKKDSKSDKVESEKSSSKTKTETQKYELSATVANTGPQEGTFDLEWYFFRRPLDNNGDKGDPILCEKGKTSLTIPGMKRVVQKIESEEISNTESKTSKNSSGNSDKGGSSSSKTISGDIYGGYILLVRSGGEILAKYSNEKKFLEDEWMGKLASPVSKGSNKKPSGKSDDGKKKKNKK
jgi:hypothetical protein